MVQSLLEVNVDEIMGNRDRINEGDVNDLREWRRCLSPNEIIATEDNTPGESELTIILKDGKYYLYDTWEFDDAAISRLDEEFDDVTEAETYLQKLLIELIIQDNMASDSCTPQEWYEEWCPGRSFETDRERLNFSTQRRES